MEPQPPEEFDSPRSSAPDEFEPHRPTDGSGKAVASLVLGIVGMVVWCLPILGLPVGVIGLILGMKARESEKRNLAIAGIVLCVIVLVLSGINAILGAFLGFQQAA